MGWASASPLFGAIIDSVMEHVKDEETRYQIYGPIFDEFRSHDWDTVDECVGVDPAFDRLYDEEYGLDDEDEDEDDTDE